MRIKNISVYASDFKAFNDPPIEDKIDKVECVKSIYSILTDVSVMYFGLHPTQIQDVVLKKAIEIILKKYQKLRLSEILHAFDRVEIGRQITLVVDDLINPIKRYYSIKDQINSEFKLLGKELDEEQKAEERDRIFVIECKKIYNESVDQLEWKGSIFHASRIAKEFLADQIDKEIKSELWLESLKEEEIFTDDYDVWLKNFGRTSIRIFSEKIVIEAIKQGIKI